MVKQPEHCPYSGGSPGQRSEGSPDKPPRPPARSPVNPIQESSAAVQCFQDVTDEFAKGGCLIGDSSPVDTCHRRSLAGQRECDVDPAHRAPAIAVPLRLKACPQMRQRLRYTGAALFWPRVIMRKMRLKLWSTVLLVPLLVSGCWSGRVTIDVESLDQARDCDYRFSLTNGDETQSLTIRVYNVQSNGLPSSMASPGRVPDEDWRGWIVVGSNLFANHCQDTNGPPDLEPDIDETWDIVAGSLHIVSLTQEDRCAARAEATDLVARNLDGQDVVLGDFELTNGTWGHVPGLQSGASCPDL